MMVTYPVEVYIYESSPESRNWCRDQFMQILFNEVTIHTSVVVHGVEYHYGENGIEEHTPKLRPQYNDDFFEEGVTRKTTVAKTKLTKLEVDAEIAKLRKKSTWLAYKFNPIEHNCHHFSDIFVKLLCGEEAALPSEVYNFNKELILCRDSWIDEFYEEQRLESIKFNLECIHFY